MKRNRKPKRDRIREGADAWLNRMLAPGYADYVRADSAAKVLDSHFAKGGALQIETDDLTIIIRARRK